MVNTAVLFQDLSNTSGASSLPLEVESVVVVFDAEFATGQSQTVEFAPDCASKSGNVGRVTRANGAGEVCVKTTGYKKRQSPRKLQRAPTYPALYLAHTEAGDTD